MFTDTVGFFNFVNVNLNLWTVQQTVFSDFWKCFWAHAVVACRSEAGIQKWFPVMWRFLQIISVLPQYASCFFLGSSTWCNVTELQNLPPAVSFKYQLLFQHFVALLHFYVTCVVYIKFKLNFFLSLNLHLISLNIWNVFFCLLWIKHGFVDLQIIAFWFYLHFTQSWRWKHRMLVNT